MKTKYLLTFFILVLTSCGVKPPIPEKTLTLPAVQYGQLATKCKGLDVLAFARMESSDISNQITRPICFGTLQGTFGDVIPNLTDLLVRNLLFAYRIHLADGTCIRNHTCTKGSVQYSDYKILKTRAAQIESLHQKFPGASCYLSPFLEHDDKNQAEVNKWFAIIHQYAPSCYPVVSAWTGYRPPGILFEGHGQTVHGDIVSHDGFDGFQTVNIDNWWTGSNMSLFWANRFNLRYNGDHNPTPPPPMQRKALASKDYIAHALRLFTPMMPQPPAPKVCIKVIQIKPPWLSKVRSEDFGPGNSDKRSDKPMLIANYGASNFNILSPAGAHIGCAKIYPGKYNGMNRFYEGNCSGLTAMELTSKGGSEWSFWQNGHTCIAYNNLRRLGAAQK